MTLSPTRLPIDTELETILTSFDTVYTWKYDGVKEGLMELYAKAKQNQWDGDVDLDWSTDVDPESTILPREASLLAVYEPVAKLNPVERARLAHAELSFTLSNFLHGEQGAMIVASQIVSSALWPDAMAAVYDRSHSELASRRWLLVGTTSITAAFSPARKVSRSTMICTPPWR